MKNKLAELLKEEFRKREELESTVSVLQDVRYYQNQANESKYKNEELEQYGRRLCVRVDKVLPLIHKVECDIPQVVIDRADRIGKSYVEKTLKKYVKVP